MRTTWLAGAVGLSLALAGLSPAAKATAPPEPGLTAIAAQVTAESGPVSRTGFGLNQLVAVPRPGVASKTIAALVEGTATLYQPGQIELLANPGPTERTHLTLVKVASSIGPEVKMALETSGLFEAVDFDGLATISDYASIPDDPAFDLKDEAGTFIGQMALKGPPGARFNEVWPLLNSFSTPATAPVAVIDSGCALDHLDHANNMVAGYDFGENKADVDPWSLTDHDAWHGSAVASVIGAGTNNGRGVAGAAWDNQVICYKAANAKGELLISAVVDSMIDALAHGAKVINLSLSSPTYMEYFQWVIDQATAQGVVVVAAAGNNAIKDLGQGVNSISYPAGYDGVLTVGSINWQGQHSDFSNYNPQTQVALSAVGEDVWAWDCPPPACGNYFPWDGTSFSAPLVAAAAAMVLRARPGLSPAAVAWMLTSSASQLPGSRPNAATGTGALDAKAAVDLALASPTPPWFTPPHNGVFNVMPATKFALALGLGGEPMPKPVPAEGSFLPPGTALVLDPKVGWVLSGSVAAPGRHAMTVNAILDNAIVETKQITLSVGGEGAFKAKAAVAKPKINFLQTGQLKLTIDVESGQPSGWYVATHVGSGAVLAKGAWVGGTQVIRLSKLPMGRHRIRLTLYEAGWYGAKDWVGNLDPAFELTVTKIKPTIKLKRHGRKLSIRLKAPIKVRGQIKIKYRAGKVVKTRKVKLKSGRRTITMPAGRFKVKVTYTGNASIAKRAVKAKIFRFR